MRKYSRSSEREVDHREIPPGIYDHLCRFDYDFYEDQWAWRKTDYWGVPITIDPDYTIIRNYEIPSYVFIRKDATDYVQKKYGLPILKGSKSRRFPFTYARKYNKVNMESFYSPAKKRSLRIDEILAEEETDFSNTLELYFP